LEENGMAARRTMTIETTRLLKMIETVCIAIGPPVTAYSLASFTVDQYGYYYRDTEFGIAVGVFLISLFFALRYWRRES
jgi:hypothetical protein